jgi:hypothetical protein
MVTCEILNDTGTNEDLEFKFHIRHAEGDEKHRSRYNIFVPSHTSKGLDIQLIDFGERTDKPGEYTAEGILLRKRTNEDLHRKTFRFYLKTEPPKIGRSFISGFGFIKGRKSDGTLQFFGKWKNLPINEKGVMNVIFDHPEFVRARERAKTKRDLKKDMLLYIVSCGINEALQKLLEMNSVEKVIEPDKIRSIRQSCDEMLYEAAIRTE